MNWSYEEEITYFSAEQNTNEGRYYCSCNGRNRNTNRFLMRMEILWWYWLGHWIIIDLNWIKRAIRPELSIDPITHWILLGDYLLECWSVTHSSVGYEHRSLENPLGSLENLPARRALVLEMLEKNFARFSLGSVCARKKLRSSSLGSNLLCSKCSK